MEWSCITAQQLPEKSLDPNAFVPALTAGWIGSDWVRILGPATPAENVVWLTVHWSFTGRPAAWGYKLIIPSTDGRLMRFWKLLRNAGLDLRGSGLTERALGWYVYFGTITPDFIVEIAKIEYVFEESITEKDEQDFLANYRQVASWQTAMPSPY